jgi:hypothetical protein
MTLKKRRPDDAGDHHRGDADDHSAVTSDRSRTNRRSAATWAQRHRSRLDRIFAESDPWTGDREWTDAELRAVKLAAEHLRSLGLYGSWQTSQGARAAWRCRRCPCQRRDVA